MSVASLSTSILPLKSWHDYAFTENRGRRIRASAVSESSLFFSLCVKKNENLFGIVHHVKFFCFFMYCRAPALASPAFVPDAALPPRRLVPDAALPPASMQACIHAGVDSGFCRNDWRGCDRVLPGTAKGRRDDDGGGTPLYAGPVITCEAASPGLPASLRRQ